MLSQKQHPPQMIAGNSLASIYRNIFDTKGKYTISVLDALKRIKQGNSAKSVIDLRNELSEERQKDIKSGLPSVTFSGTFESREDDKILQHSGFICLDFDAVKDLESTKSLLTCWEYTYAAWLSPRGQGLRALVRISDGSKHREHFMAMKRIWPDMDHKCINPSRVTYESYDPDLYLNEDAKVWKEAIKFEVHQEIKVSDNHEAYKKLVRWMENKGRAFASGNRNQYIYVLAGAMCRYGFSEQESETILVQDYSTGNDFNAKEITRTCQSAFKKNQDKAGTLRFENESLSSTETSFEIDPAIFEEGFKLVDIIYASDVYDRAADIYSNGYQTAESTRIPQLDEFFKWKRGEISLLGGIGNYGKSHYFSFLQLVKSYFDGTKWAVFSPENFPAEDYFIDLTEMLLGCASFGHHKPERVYFDNAYQFISKHFFYVYPEQFLPTPEYVKSKFLELILKEGVSGCCIDPFNQMANDYAKSGGRSDKYLESFLADCKRFAQQNNIYFSIIAHPTKLKKEANGNYPCPDVYDLAEGAMWSNKMDNILIYHRPFGQSEPDNPTCEHHSKKIRRQKVVGKRGFTEFTLDRKRRRFYFKGYCPLDGNKYEPGHEQTSLTGQSNLVEHEQFPF